MDLEGQSAIITGASSGIGEATSLVLAEAGADVTLAGRRTGALSSVAKQIEETTAASALVKRTDVRQESQVDSMVQATLDEFGSIDILVNNAGVSMGLEHPVDSLPTSEYRTMIETNVDGVFFATRACLSHLRASMGNLVFISSINSYYPYSHSPVYAATKGWVSAFAASIEASAGDDGVALTVINPGTVRTELSVDGGTTCEEKFSEEEAISPQTVAEVVKVACTMDPPATISEVDITERDMLSRNWNM